MMRKLSASTLIRSRRCGPRSAGRRRFCSKITLEEVGDALNSATFRLKPDRSVNITAHLLRRDPRCARRCARRRRPAACALSIISRGEPPSAFRSPGRARRPCPRPDHGRQTKEREVGAARLGARGDQEHSARHRRRIDGGAGRRGRPRPTRAAGRRAAGRPSTTESQASVVGVAGSRPWPAPTATCPRGRARARRQPVACVHRR